MRGLVDAIERRRHTIDQVMAAARPATSRRRASVVRGQRAAAIGTSSRADGVASLENGC